MTDKQWIEYGQEAADRAQRMLNLIVLKLF